MSVFYEEFTSTVGSIRDLLTSKIAAHADWDVLAVTGLPAAVTNTSALGTTGTLVPVSSTAGFVVGMAVKLTISGAVYRRTLTAVSSTQLTINSNLAQGTTTAVGGVTIEPDVLILKGTTTRGAQMVVEIRDYRTATAGPTSGVGLAYRLYRSHPGGAYTAGVDPTEWRYVFWSQAAVSEAATLRATLSMSKEHLFFSLEGPRANETEAFSTTFGSVKNYMFICDVVPYLDTDTVPAVCSWGLINPDTDPRVEDLLWRCEVSRNLQNDLSWGAARLPTVTLPHFGTGAATNADNYSPGDNRSYLWPYVVVEESSGVRGRLASIFFIGISRTTYSIDPNSVVGEMITEGGIVYKTILAHKGNGADAAGGGLGVYAFTSSSNLGLGSIVIAVPYATV